MATPLFAQVFLQLGNRNLPEMKDRRRQGRVDADVEDALEIFPSCRLRPTR